MMWLLLVLAIVAGAAIFIFNRLVRLRHQVRAAWSDIDVQLMRRHDLIPQLVESTKAYASFERETLALTALLRSAREDNRPAAQEVIEQGINEQLARFMMLHEDYPDLKANTTFLELMKNLSDTEDKLQFARRYYNGCVRVFNTRIEQFPDILIAKPFAFAAADFFELESIGIRNNIRVQLHA